MTKSSDVNTRRLQKLLFWGICMVIALMPFHAFFTTWASTLFGHLLVLRAWKEALLIPLFILAVILLLKDRRLRDAFFHYNVARYGLLFALWILLTTIFLNHDADSAVLGVVIHLRGPLFFLLAVVAVSFSPVSEKFLQKLVTYPAIGVVAFGLLQLFVLPHDFLRHFGYQKYTTIPPFFTIDEQQDKIRIISTLRGPNPLGVYLIAPLLVTVQGIQTHFSRWKRQSILFCGVVLSGLFVLYGSHSRSAWLGLLAGLGVYVWCVFSKKWRIIALAVGLALAGIVGGLLYTSRNSSFVQDVVLHDNPDEGGDVSSNGSRITALYSAIDDVATSPVVGCGPGCAGPASAHYNDGANISENFFIQIVQEAGVVGLGLFLLLFITVLLQLYRLRTPFAYAWLGVAIGVSVASVLSHAWADDTVAYLWWGVAGLLIGLPKYARQQKE